MEPKANGKRNRSPIDNFSTDDHDVVNREECAKTLNSKSCLFGLSIAARQEPGLHRQRHAA
jgi:hypothetical protein